MNEKAQELWVKKILALFKPSVLFDLVLLFASLWVIYRGRNRKVTVGDYLGLLIYSWYRFVDRFWVFHPLFYTGGGIAHYSLLYIDLPGLYWATPMVFKAILFFKIPKKPVYPDGYLYPDLPINKESDRRNIPLEDIDREGLKRNKFAMQIADSIEQTMPFQAFAIGICGPWGSGKTSLIELIVNCLKNKKTKREYIFMQFSPWFFENSEMLIKSFFGELESKFRSNKLLTFQLKEYSKQITRVEKSLLSTEFSEFFFPDEQGLKDRYDAIIAGIREANKFLVISIDDLDRLESKEIVQVFRLIRLLADFPNTFYIVGYDKKYVSAAIQNELTRHSPEKFTDKVFNIEFKIPETNPANIRQRLRLAIEKQISILGKNTVQIDQNEFNEAIAFKPVAAFIKNERDIKRFTNNLMMRYLTLKEEINFYYFFLLELLYYNDADIFNAVYEKKSLLLAKYAEQMARRKDDDVVDYRNLLGITISDAAALIIDILFAKNSHAKRYSIANDMYFDRYFSLSLLDIDFSSAQFEAAFASPLEELQGKLAGFNRLNSSLLREKLLYKFRDYNPAGDASFTKTVDGLLMLYMEVYHSVNTMGNNDLNPNNLAGLIFDIVRLSDRSLQTLCNRLVIPNIKDYAPFSHLTSLGKIKMFESPYSFEELGRIKTLFRNTQGQLLKKSIIANQDVFNETFMVNFESICDFIGKNEDGSFNKSDISWFTDNIITESKEFILRNLNDVLDYVKNESTTLGTFEQSKAVEMLDKIFLSSTLPVYSNPVFEKLTDFYAGYEEIKKQLYSFNQQTPKDLNFPEFNDHVYHEQFPLDGGLRFLININPANSPFWRFGLRFSKSKEFPPIIKARHVDGTSYIQLVKGKIKDNGEGEDEPGKGLRLSIYIAEREVLDEPVYPVYNNTLVSFSVDHEPNGDFIVNIGGQGKDTRSLKRIEILKDYRYAQIVAWADKRTFSISTEFRILKRIT